MIRLKHVLIKSLKNNFMAKQGNPFKGPNNLDTILWHEISICLLAIFVTQLHRQNTFLIHKILAFIVSVQNNKVLRKNLASYQILKEDATIWHVK